MVAVTAHLPTKVVSLRERWLDSRIGRAITWYNVRCGNQLAGGIAYAAMFSLIAALTIGYSVLNAVMGQNPGLTNAVLEEVQRWLPGLIGPGNDTPLSVDTIPTLPRVVNPASVVAAIVLLFSATGMINAIRKAVWAMFRAAPVQDSFVRARLRSVLGFFLLAIGFLLAAVSSIGTEAFGHWYYPGHPELHWVLVLLTGIIGIPIDTLVVAAVIRFVAEVKPEGKQQTRGFWAACLFAGVVATLLRVASTQIVVFAAGRNMLYLKQFAAFITVLVLANLLARTLLYVCAWIKNPPRVDELPETVEIGEDFFD